MSIHVPVDPTGLVPLAYWKQGAEFPPKIEGVGERYEQFKTYTDLARGKFDAILPDWLGSQNVPVQDNYFHTVSDMRTSFLMMNPPEAAIDDDLNDELDAALYDFIYNANIYGTSLLHVYNDGKPHVLSVNPTNWFPAEDGDALVFELRDRYEVHLLTADGNRRIIFERNDEGDFRLGRVIESTDYSTLPGRPLFPCGIRPKWGEWGKSLIPTIAPQNIELVKINTRISDIHDMSSEPILLIQNDTVEDARSLENLPTSGDNTRGTRNEREVAFFQHQRKTGYFLGVKGTVTAIPTLAETEDMREQAKALRNAIYVATATPVNFLGAQDGMASAAVSGESIRRASAYAEATFRSLQREIERCVNKALQLATGQSELKITWKNPFEEMDVQRESDTIRDDGEEG